MRYMVDYSLVVHDPGLPRGSVRHFMAGPFTQRKWAESTVANLASNPDLRGADIRDIKERPSRVKDNKTPDDHYNAGFNDALASWNQEQR